MSKLNWTLLNYSQNRLFYIEMAHPSDQMHQMNVLREEAIHGTPSNRIDSLPDQDHAFVDRNVPPPDQRPPALGYIPLPEPRPEFSHTYFSEMYSFADRRTERTLNGRTLSLRTMTNTTSMPETVNLDRANTNSPSQRAHSFHAMGAITSSIYPPLRPDGTSEETTTSPRTDRLLPSFHQLSKIADGGTEASDPRKTGLANLSTYAGQGIAQAVTTSYPHFPPSQQSSPSTNPMLLGHPSPTSTRTEGPEAYAHAHPPAPFSGPNTFHSRRKSAGNTRPPSFIPSMTGSSNVTSSSSNDTIGSHQSHRSSDAGGYSTNTTPMESTPSSLDDTPKSSGPPRLQSSTSAPSVSAVFLCDYPGCSAPPFQTQYLLK